MKPFKRKLASSLALFIFLSAVQLASAFYVPSLGRWLNRDPLSDSVHASDHIILGQHPSKGTTEPVETWHGPNLYSFTGNDPLNSTDPDGRLCIGVGVCRLSSPIRGATDVGVRWRHD